jgi:hypothetical protein
LLRAARAKQETNGQMALHRDIYWVGRQWAVTGYGIQACNQKQKSSFDIEGSRLWEDGVLESLRAEKWLNIEDFDKALEVARKYYPEPPRKGMPHGESLLASSEAVLKEIGANAPALKEPVSKIPDLNRTNSKEMNSKECPIERPKPAAQNFHMRVEGWPAKFVSQWRIRFKR